MSAPSWQPAASPQMLQFRARTLARIRDFFAAADVLEVETPALSTAGVSDVSLEAMTVGSARDGATAHYLHTSPEYAMKRLLAAGVGDIYQICRVFRATELGRWHEPEFTLLEWYRLGWDENQLMTEVEALLQTLLRSDGGTLNTISFRYEEVFREFLGTDSLQDTETIRQELAAANVDVPADLDDDGLLDLALSEVVTPRLEPEAITFIYDFPASQAALAQIKPQSPPVAARFEAFSGGIELANGFAELTDASEQRQRFEADLARRRKEERHVPPLDERFLAALEAGLPRCAGVAVGIDRVIALASGLSEVAATMTFPHGRDTR